MSVAVDRVARKYLNVVAGSAISVDIPCFSEDHVVVLYGRVGAVALLDTDYTVTLDEAGGYDDFTVTPTLSLLTKINALIAGDPTETNQIVVRRELDLLTDITPETAFFRKKLATELDKTAMRFQQLSEVDGRTLRITATDMQEGGPYSLELPDAARRANKAVVFDADGNVSVSVDDYVNQAADAAASAAAAAASEATVAASAAAALASQNAAAGSATAASASATAAATSATNAANSATAASTSATNSANSATAAAVSATNAGNSATAAANSATTATTQATAAAGSATAAATSATNSSNSATAAAASATNANNSATAAATSATNAGNSATASAASATNAATSATAAAASATAIGLPGAVGNGGKYLRQKTTEDGFEYRTAAQTRTDLSVAALNSDIAAAGFTYTQGGTGAVARTVASKLGDVLVSVKDFGAVGNAIADDTAAVQATVTYVKSVGGGIVHIPRGTHCRVTSPILVDGNSVRIVGEACGACSLMTTTPNISVLKFSGASRCSLENLLVYGNVFSGANPLVWLYNVVQCVVDRCWLQGGYGNILVSGDACADNHILRNTFTYSTGKEMLQINRAAATGVCGAIHMYRNTFNQAYPVLVPTSAKYKGARANSTAYAAGDMVSQAGYYYQCQTPGVSAAALPSFAGWYGAAIADGTCVWQLVGHTDYTGVRIDSGTSYIRIRECDLTGPFAQAIKLDNSGATDIPYDIVVEQCTAHGPISLGLYVRYGTEIDIQSFNAFNATGVGTTYGVFIDPSVQGVTVDRCRLFGFTNGLYVAGTSVVANGNEIVGNTTGVRVQAGTSGFSLIGNAVGSIASRGQNTTGILVETGASDYYNIIGNSLKGATTGITDGGTGTHKSVTGNN